MKKHLLGIILLIFSSQILLAQPGCPNVTVTPANTTICSGCTTLTATVQGTVTTTSYTADSIPYTPYSYNTGTPVLIGVDDLWSGVITLPFCFDFYGATYNQCIIGSNGCIGFNIANANQYNTWPIGAPIPSAAPTDMLNTIMGPWHDVDPGVAGQQYFDLQGTAPCRRLVVSWYQIAMFQCNSLIATHQIVLYETTNIIEVYIENKPICITWNAGTAIEGIQDNTGTQAVVVPGRNYPTQWTASNDAWRFTPAGAPQYTLTWLNGNNPIGTGDTITVCPAVTTTYTAQLVNNTCSGPVTVTSQATVNVVQAFTLSTSSVPATCNGNNGSATVTVNGNPGTYTYSWSTTPPQSTQTATGLGAGIYTVTVTDQNNCSITASVTVSTTSSLSASASVTGPDPICIGSSTTIAASVSGGTTPFTYAWTPSASLTTPAAQTSTATPSSTTTYTVTVTDSAGCISVSNVIVVVNPLPVLVTTGDVSLCLGQSTTLGIAGADTYVWSPSTALSATTGNSVDANPTVTTTYTITGTNSTTGCTGTATLTVTVNPLPLVVTPPAPVICSGGNVNITLSGAAYYHWTPQTGITSVNGSDSSAVTVSLTQTTCYTVVGFSAEGCSATTSFCVTVNPNPVPVIVPSGPTVFCLGGSVDLLATPVGTYLWSTSDTTQSIQVMSTGTFTVTVTDVNGCTGTSAPQNVTVNPLPTPSISPVGPIAFCQGDSIVLTATGGVSFLWSNSSITQSIVANASGTYTVTVTDINNCSSATSVVVNVIPPPPAVISPAGPVLICSNNPATLFANTGPGYTYQWYFNGNPIVGETTDQYTTSVPGLYSVSVTDAIGCSSVSNDVQVALGAGPVVTIVSPPALGCLQNTIYIDYGPQSITLTAVATPVAASYLWSTGETTQSITVTTAGNYSVIAFDANGCPSPNPAYLSP
ncbi:MAG: SprB repeat-containing protein, partial [Bacteroidia bacterium]|nr:SprB repeat-containing protein [Bacteroidia bacterium]